MCERRWRFSESGILLPAAVSFTVTPAPWIHVGLRSSGEESGLADWRLWRMPPRSLLIGPLVHFPLGGFCMCLSACLILSPLGLLAFELLLTALAFYLLAHDLLRNHHHHHEHITTTSSV